MIKNKKNSNQKDSKKEQKKGLVKSVKTFFTDERFTVSLGLTLLAFSLILCLSLTSYLFTWKTDQSIADLGFKGIFSDSAFEVDNWVGKFGAFLANKFIFDWFGIPSFSFVILSAVYGLALLKVKLVKLLEFTFKLLIYTFWLSIALASVFGDKYFMVGGSHGFFVFNWLYDVIGPVGAYTSIVISAFIIVIYSVKNSLNWMKSKVDRIKNFDKENLTEEEIETESEKSLLITETDNNENTTYGQSVEPIVLEEDIKSEELHLDEKLDKEIEIGEKNLEIKSEGNNFSMTVQVADEEETLSDEEVHSDLLQDYDPTKDLEYYKMPTLDLLTDYPSSKGDVTREELNANKNKIVKTLLDYKIQISKIMATIGPTVTLYEIVPAPGVRISKIKSLEDDIALSLAALGIRIIAPIPGKGTIGIEVPNSKPEIVSMRSVLKSAKFQESDYELPVAIGKTISNETYVFNLAKTPHLLVAGATGQGKSVGINAIITSLLYKKHPSQLKFVLVDPKMVELSIYRNIEKHYLAKLPGEENPIITDVSKVVPAMLSLCIEMDTRYALLTDAGVRNIIEYNSKFISRKLNPQKGHYFMPYIVVIIDEFADIIVQEGKQVEAPISRLAAKARAVGIHLIVATQRPSTDVITGVIKANFPTRIAFKVTNGHDSKTILDATGANQLIGRGDMLISETGKITRVQCAFIDTTEVENLVNYISSQQGYPSAMELPEPVFGEGETGGAAFDANEKDELFEEAARIVVRHQQGSTSLIQRKLSIGYNRAGRIIDQLEAAGIVGPYEGSKARQVNFPDELALEQYLNTLKINNN
jgi:S-DNA-T family DNA segregation ATPase FtsK/SpoIIIE